MNAVLFDLDGTLVDTLPGIERASFRALEACGAPIVRADFRSLIGPPIRGILGIISGWDTSTELDRLERAFRVAYDGGEWQRSTLYPGVASTLRQLAQAGTRLYVVTNKPREASRRILEHLGVWPFFSALFTPDSRQPPFKTKAEALCRLRDDEGLSPASMLFVGDSLDDAHAASVAGCQFAAVTFGYGTGASQTEHPVHFRLDQMHELVSILTPAFPTTHP